MKARRMWLLVRQSLREAMHLRLAWVVGTAALALVAGASVLRDFNFGVEEARFFEDWTSGIVMLFGTVQAVLLTITMIQGGLERGLPGLLFARGVRRSEWLVACLVAVWLAQAWLALSAYSLLGCLLICHGHAEAVTSLCATCGLHVLRLGLIAVFALIMSIVSRSPLLATVLALALTLGAQLAPVITWAASHSRLAARVAWTLLGRALPNFTAFAAGAGLGRGLVVAGAYAVVYTLAACLIFSQREI